MLIDAYHHVGLPRFQSAADVIAALDGAGVDKALVCAFETCPDLLEVHRTLMSAPERILALGLAIGDERAHIEAAMMAQLAAGFSGFRLSGGDIERTPWVLDLVGEQGAIALVCSSEGLHREAAALLAMLREFPDALVVGGHFAGPTELSVFEAPGVAELFAHERFAVIASRQGLYDDAVLEPWFAELRRRLGAGRLLWGSEAPVLYWRDETIADAAKWAAARIGDPLELAAVLGDAAERLLFSRPRARPGPLALDFNPMSFTDVKPAAMWPHGLSLPDAIAGRIVHHWLHSSGGGADGSTLRELLTCLLDDALPEPVHSRERPQGEM
jgi:hypothetical protein